MSKQFRRLFDQLGHKSLLTPYLEQALMEKMSSSWPNEWSIKVDNSERYWDGRFHPSSDAAAPELLLFYKFHPKIRLAREPLKVEDIMTFQIGSAYHALVQSMLIHLGLTTAEEVEVPFFNEERNCSGKVDVRRVFLPDGQTPPVEIKSAGYIPKEPPLYYLQQFQVYMDLGCTEPQETGLLLYIQKQSPHRFREFVIKRDEALLQSIYTKWNHVLEAISFNDPSTLEYPCHEFNSREHLRCPARNICLLGQPTLRAKS